MAEAAASGTPTPSGGDGGSSNTKFIFFGLALFALIGGAFYLYKRNSSAGGADTGMKPVDESAQKPVGGKEAPAANSVSVSTATKIAAANTGASGDGISPLRTDHDAAWNYQKRNGVWWTAKKDGSVGWTSLAKNTVATNILNQAYPND